MENPSSLTARSFFSLDHPWKWLWLLFLLAFAIRILFLLEISSSLAFEFNLLAGTDMKGFIDWASRIADGNWMGRDEGTFWQAPLFPYFLGTIFTLLGKEIFLAAVIQMLLGATTVVLIAYLGKLAFDERVGLWAGLIAMLYGPFIFFGAVLHSTTLEVFVTAAMLVQLTYALRHPTRANWLCSGILIGLACLARPNILLFPMFLSFVFWMRSREEGKRAWKAALLIGIGIALTIAPVTLRNYVVGGQFTVISGSGPETFRQGNSYDSGAVGMVYPEQPLMPLYSWPFWRHLFTKAVLFFWGYEAPQNVNYYLFQEFSQVLKLPIFFPFWIVVPLGLVGIFLTVKQWRENLHLHAFMASYYLSVILFYIIGRFRLPLLPPLIVFAAYALVEGYQRIKQGEIQKVVMGGLAFLALALVIRPWGVELIRPNDYGMLAQILMNRGRHGDAIIVLSKAAEKKPSFPGLNHDLGFLFALEGRYEEAMLHFERELKVNPKHVVAHRHLGVLYMEHRKDQQKALFHLERSLELAPEGKWAEDTRKRIQLLEQKKGST